VWWLVVALQLLYWYVLACAAAVLYDRTLGGRN